VPPGILPAAGQTARGTLKASGLAFAVGVGEHLAKGVVGEALCCTVRVVDAQHFTIRLALQRGGLVQRVGDGYQVLTLVIAVVSTLARAVFKALDLGVGVPPQVLGLEVRIDDRVRQAILTVEVLGLVAKWVDLGNQIALAVVTRLPDAAIGEAGFSYQWRGEVVFVADLAAQWIGFLDEPAKVIVLARCCRPGGSGRPCCRSRPAHWRGARRRSRGWQTRGGRRCTAPPARGRVRPWPS
jgi:hypothetical protein